MADSEILISIDEPKIKFISEVLGNKSCKKILDYLSLHDATVSDLANELKMPINTVDYNIKKLIKSEFIEKKSFWWSTRGKKMPIYTLSNKRIIISPKKNKNYYSYFLAFIATGIIALFLKIFKVGQNKFNLLMDFANRNQGVLLSANEKAIAPSVLERSADLVSSGSGEVASQIANYGTVSVVNGYYGVEAWLWFLIGAWLVIVLFLLINLFYERRFKK